LNKLLSIQAVEMAHRWRVHTKPYFTWSS